LTIEERKQLPPWVSYKIFDIFLGKLQQYLPTRIDRSYWGDMFSGMIGTQLISAMRYLNLIDVNQKPTARLRVLIDALGEHQDALMRQIADESYAFVFKGNIDILTSSYADLEAVFRTAYRMDDDICHKCIRFFIEFCKDAGIPLSQEIVKKQKIRSSGSDTKSAHISDANDEKNLEQLINDHNKTDWEECRWCFAIDQKTVKARQIAHYHFPDATIIHMKCDRCGGEYSYYFRAWGEDYIKERIAALYPALKDQITDDMIVTINHRLSSEDYGDH